MSLKTQKKNNTGLDWKDCLLFPAMWIIFFLIAIFFVVGLLKTMGYFLENQIVGGAVLGVLWLVLLGLILFSNYITSRRNKKKLSEERGVV